MSDADILPPTYADLGITDRHVAADALDVAKIEEQIFQEYIETDEPTFEGLLRFAAVFRHYPEIDEIHGYLLTPPDLLAWFRARISGTPAHFRDRRVLTL